MARSRSSTLALLLACGALALGACGEDEETTPAAENTPTPEAEIATPEGGGGGGGGGEVQVSAVEGEGGLGWDPEALTAQAGTVTIAMENPDGNTMPHTVALEGNGADASGEPVQAGETSTVEAELEAGEYTFYCPVGQHRQNGMEGTLTVE